MPSLGVWELLIVLVIILLILAPVVVALLVALGAVLFRNPRGTARIEEDDEGDEHSG